MKSNCFRSLGGSEAHAVHSSGAQVFRGKLAKRRRWTAVLQQRFHRENRDQTEVAVVRCPLFDREPSQRVLI